MDDRELTKSDVRAISEWLGLSASVIKSGEPWTATCSTVHARARDAINALADRLERAEGWVMVPREPTEAMVNAGVNAWEDARGQNCRAAYAAMLSSLPSPPKS